MSEKEAKSNEINLTVKAQDGNVICFKLRKNTQLKKLMETYCSRSGLHIKSVRFIYEGDRLKETDTPESGWRTQTKSTPWWSSTEEEERPIKSRRIRVPIKREEFSHSISNS